MGETMMERVRSGQQKTKAEAEAQAKTRRHLPTQGVATEVDAVRLGFDQLQIRYDRWGREALAFKKNLLKPSTRNAERWGLPCLMSFIWGMENS